MERHLTEVFPFVAKVQKKVFESATRVSGLCPRGLIYNYAMDYIGAGYASVFFFSIQHGQTVKEVKVPNVLASNNASMTAMYFDAHKLFVLYGNTLIAVAPENSTILSTTTVWPAGMNCVPQQRLSYDLANKKLLAHCTVYNTPTNCHYITTIDPVSLQVSVPPCLGTTKNSIAYFAPYTQVRSVRAQPSTRLR